MSRIRGRVRRNAASMRGSIVQSAVETIARAEGSSQAAALVRMAEIALATVADTENRYAAYVGDERAAVVIHLTAADLPADTCADGAPPRTPQPRSAERTTDGPPRPYAHIVGGPGLPDSVVQRLTCARGGSARPCRNRTAPCLTSVAPIGWSANGCTARYYCATTAAAHTPAAPIPAT